MTELAREVQALVAAKKEKAEKIALDIWNYAEIAYQETQSAAELEEALTSEGFEVKTNIADIPTAFTATYVSGSGKPVMGILAEYDALDGLSQKAAVTEEEPVVAGGCGHGCGHNLLGGGAYAAAVAVKDYLQKTGKNGTIILFGCPAEEGAGSKQFIARAGYFDNVDFAYTWHPATVNEVSADGSVAIMGANFIFDGIASHAGGAPHLGRSALDGCELMNIGVNYLREHMLDQARVHYAYSDAGGTAPNVVQSHAVIKYEVRAPKVRQMQELFARVAKIAEGAAIMTETKMHYDITMAFSDYRPNKTLAPVVAEALEDLGAPEWTEEEYKMAADMLRTYSRGTLNNIKENLAETFEGADVAQMLEKPLHSGIRAFDPRFFQYKSGSTDVGDVGYATPTVELHVATACLGNVGHSWQNTSFAGSNIGLKGMIRAAEVLALACIRTMDQPDLIAKAKEELLVKNGGKYVCPLPDYVTPPIGRY